MHTTLVFALWAVRDYFALGEAIGETLVLVFRVLAIIALFALVLWVPRVCEAFRERRWYGEPLGKGTYWRVGGCVLAVLIVWHAHFFS